MRSKALWKKQGKKTLHTELFETVEVTEGVKDKYVILSIWDPMQSFVGMRTLHGNKYVVKGCTVLFSTVSFFFFF